MGLFDNNDWEKLSDLKRRKLITNNENQKKAELEEQYLRALIHIVRRCAKQFADDAIKLGLRPPKRKMFYYAWRISLRVIRDEFSEKPDMISGTFYVDKKGNLRIMKYNDYREMSDDDILEQVSEKQHHGSGYICIATEIEIVNSFKDSLTSYALDSF